MKALKQIISFVFITVLIVGCTSRTPRPDPAYYRDSSEFRQSIENFAKQNNKTTNKITKEDVIAEFGKFDKETKTLINGKNTPVFVYYSQSEEFKGGKYTGKNNRDTFYIFVFEDKYLTRILMRGLNYSIHKGDNIVKIKDRSQASIEFGIEYKENPKWVSGRDLSLLNIKR